MICRVMSGNGAGTGMENIQAVLRPTPAVLPTAALPFCVAGRGTSTTTAVVLPPAVGAIGQTPATATGFVLPGLVYDYPLYFYPFTLCFFNFQKKGQLKRGQYGERK